MKDLTARELSRCRECGKLIALHPGDSLCSECKDEAGLAVSDSARSHAEEPFSNLDTDATCVRCRMRPSLEESEFCLNCQVELVSDLGALAEDLIVKIETLDEDARPPLGVLDMYAAKRGRTATSRINVVGGQPLKWWRVE